MARTQHHFPDLPSIGLPESHYAQMAQKADRCGDVFGREAAKVGQYITLALAPGLDWPSKKRYFEHALHRHCSCPPLPDEDVWLFYKRLADLVRQYAGHEALRLACSEDDQYAFLERRGIPRKQIVDKANAFFGAIMGTDGFHRPDMFTEEDWAQLKLIRAQWSERR
ncbi:MAG TPA: hypothetical protein VL992_02655 [Tepidisphaeraceae bacterium]|nr:hypothetical protein [Tepidisphaeraceae bacterium]